MLPVTRFSSPKPSFIFSFRTFLFPPIQRANIFHSHCFLSWSSEAGRVLPLTKHPAHWHWLEVSHAESSWERRKAHGFYGPQKLFNLQFTKHTHTHILPCGKRSTWGFSCYFWLITFHLNVPGIYPFLQWLSFGSKQSLSPWGVIWVMFLKSGPNHRKARAPCHVRRFFFSFI